MARRTKHGTRKKPKQLGDQRQQKHGNPEVNVSVFRGGTDGKGDPEQVHLTLDFPAIMDTPLTMRFSTPDMLAKFIDELVIYRYLVWPESDSIDVGELKAYAAKLWEKSEEKLAEKKLGEEGESSE